MGIGMVWAELLPLMFTDAVNRGDGVPTVPFDGGGYRNTAPTISFPGPAGDVASAGTLSCAHGVV